MIELRYSFLFGSTPSIGGKLVTSAGTLWVRPMGLDWVCIGMIDSCSIIDLACLNARLSRERFEDGWPSQYKDAAALLSVGLVLQK